MLDDSDNPRSFPAADSSLTVLDTTIGSRHPRPENELRQRPSIYFYIVVKFLFN